jgi:hypothetical protein
VQALTQTSEAWHDNSYLALARRALPILADPPPVGVAVRTPLGRRYLLYSFDTARRDAVINGFLQTLIGLFDFASVSGDPQGWRLFRSGDAEARAELPTYDTGAWSLYQPGQEDSLDYHTLVTGFLQQLCARTHASVYCRTASRFQRYLKTPPVLQLLTRPARVGRSAAVRFRLSKVSRVGITVSYHGRTTFVTSADFGYGVRSFRVPGFSRAGTYTITLSATDLAGNHKKISGTLQASP